MLPGHQSVAHARGERLVTRSLPAPRRSGGVHGLGVRERGVADRVVIEVGLGHAEQVSQFVEQRVMDSSSKVVPVDCGPVDRQTVEGDLRGAAVFGEHSKRTRLVGTLVLDRDGDVVGGDRRLDPARQRVELGLRQRRELILRGSTGGKPVLDPHKATPPSRRDRRDHRPRALLQWQEALPEARRCGPWRRTCQPYPVRCKRQLEDGERRIAGRDVVIGLSDPHETQRGVTGNPTSAAGT